MESHYLRQVMTAKDIDLALSRIAAEIIEDHQNLDRTALVGIRRRGVPLAEVLRDKIETLTGRELELGILDINFYRDDLTKVDSHPVVGSSSLGFDVAEREIILVDDVLYTGRTTRAALESILDYGRPLKVKLVVLIDRGHRELPIQADYVGKYVETAANEVIEVKVPSIDDDEAVYLTTKELLLKAAGQNS
ncbi:MAG TPA: bifunctional pyr operon transcriptional regulator/uracil phosphoribosyltransferase PyrR [Acidobacteriota bacterium]|nr:bifunctional pyr operon transcriptional regulator/uracil phosphoribosyltransferase PyrR [Acidobacteriota bacterium]